MTEQTPPVPAGPEAAAQSAPRKKKRRWPLLLGVAVVVLVGLYAAAVFYVSGDVPPNTTVNGVQIGGLTAEEASAKLKSELGSQAKAPIPVTAVKHSMEINPAKSGLSVNWAATAGQASGTVMNPVALWTALTGTTELAPVTVVDTEKLEKSIAALADTADTTPVEPDIKYVRATAKLTDGEDGQELQVAESAQLVADSYMNPTAAELTLPVTAVPPTVSKDAAAQVMTTFAEPAVSADVIVKVSNKADAKASPAMIAASLSFSVKDGQLVPALDGAELHKSLASQLRGVEQPGQDASFKFVEGKPKIVPSKDGLAMSDDDLAKAVMAVLPETDPDKRLARVSVTKQAAAFTTADAKALNVDEQLSTFFQKYPPAEYRYINVGQAAKYLNGTLLKPGETFSMNGTIRERTRENGYTEGTIIKGGVFKEELGGGVSIITTATWTAAFYAGLQRIEQHPHGLYISRYTAGLEATVSWGYLDLKFRNDTGNGVLIQATRYNDGVRITMWGTKKYDKVTATFTERHSFTDYETIYDTNTGCVPSVGSRGFSIAVTRKLWKDGQVMKAETWPTTYKPTPQVNCRAKPE